MKLIMSFVDGSMLSIQTLRVVKELAEERDDVIAVLFRIDTRKGREVARENGITAVPTTLVTNTRTGRGSYRIVKGVPENSDQLLGNF